MKDRSAIHMVTADIIVWGDLSSDTQGRIDCVSATDVFRLERKCATV